MEFGRKSIQKLRKRHDLWTIPQLNEKFFYFWLQVFKRYTFTNASYHTFILFKIQIVDQVLLIN
jgi:hypothetical protein